MFGYVRFDKPYLYIKDHELYQAAYCGLCKSLGGVCGQASRLGLSYDATFFSLLCHNLTNRDVKIEKQSCITKFGVKRSMAVRDDLSDAVACFNSVLLYYKLSDDVEDEGRGKAKRLLFASALKKAKRAHPVLAEIVEKNMKAQRSVEKEKCDSPDRAADATATLMAEASDYLLKEFSTEFTRRLFYSVGKWIYLIHAVDDYDKDVKKGKYKPFYLAYGAASREKLAKEHKDELSFLFGTIFYDIRECLANIKFYFNRDLVDNVLLRGLPLVTDNVLSGKKTEKQK